MPKITANIKNAALMIKISLRYIVCVNKSENQNPTKASEITMQNTV